MASQNNGLPSLDCQIDPQSAKSVGDLMRLQCLGLMDPPLSTSTKFFFEDPQDSFKLYILSVEKADRSEFVATITAYKAGAFNDQSLRLGDSQARFEIKGLSWKTESVLEEAEKIQKETFSPPPEQIQPFPFFGPFSVGYPIWIWLASAVLLGIVMATFFRFWRKRSQKKRLVQAALAGVGQSGLGPSQHPMHEFGKVHRRLSRQISEKEAVENRAEELKELEKAFREFLIRRFQVPALDWSDREILADLKSEHQKSFRAVGRDLARLLNEFQKARGQVLKKQDLEQLLEQSRRVLERLEKQRDL